MGERWGGGGTGWATREEAAGGSGERLVSGIAEVESWSGLGTGGDSGLRCCVAGDSLLVVIVSLETFLLVGIMLGIGGIGILVLLVMGLLLCWTGASSRVSDGGVAVGAVSRCPRCAIVWVVSRGELFDDGGSWSSGLKALSLSDWGL